MYRTGEEYDKMARLAIEIYCDYGFSIFPIDEKMVCRKMGIALVPYSSFASDETELLLKKSEYGFLYRRGINDVPIILYNDTLSSRGSVRFTIFHELKHYVCEDTDEAPDDDLADYFGKYFLCPIPYLITKKINDPMEIIAQFDVSFTVAQYLVNNYSNRMARYGEELFEYEKPLIQLLNSEYYRKHIERGDAYEGRK